MNVLGHASYLALAVGSLCATLPAYAAPDALAKAFGAREGVASARLSPDGTKIGLIAAGDGRTSRLYVVDAVEGAMPKPILTTSGAPESLEGCDWVASDRLACTVVGTVRYSDDVFGFSNVVAVDAAGGNVKMLSQKRGQNARGWDFRGGRIIDLLPSENGTVLMTRSYVPETKIGSLIEKKLEGLGVDRIDTRSGAAKRIEDPQPLAIRYISDGRGTVRVMSVQENKGSGYATGTFRMRFRPQSGQGWSDLSTYNITDRSGFDPQAIDAVKNLVYGFEQIDGRQAVVSMALDSGREKKVVFAHPRVDVTGLIQVGRNQRPVGVSYAEEYRTAVYFDTDLKTLVQSLGKTLGGKAVQIVDMSQDEKRVLIWAGNDLEPGHYYLFDRSARSLSPVIPVRPEVSGMTLAPMKALSFKAGDGTIIPAYLTLPPGKADAKGLPAIVMPHGGPEARDEWGFDWMVQYYAARGFAVIQPQFRGSYGFGEEWMMSSGFRSWRIAVGDVVDAGRWLVAQGIADPARLTIAGWSYGGYAALQAQAIDPYLFKAVVAIAPVTTLDDLLRRSRWSAAYLIQQQRMGARAEIDDASPSSHASAFRAPVLMFHGTEDGNVDITQARIMQDKLKGAGKRSELIVYEGLEHSLIDSDMRADLLQKSADFLLAAGK